MSQKRFHILSLSCILLLLCTFYSCNTSQNTANVRAWKAFKTRYNTYFNGHEAYLEGVQTQEKGVRDNYLKMLPLFISQTENGQQLGAGNFDQAVTKCEKAIQLYSISKKPVFKRGHKLTPKEKAFKERKEFNPFIKNAWFLMGQAQMEKGEFIDAAATFAYMTRIYAKEPDVLNQARAMQAVCYAEADWFYDAEQLLDKVRRDGIPSNAKRYYNMANAEIYLRQEQWKEALPYLKTEVGYLKHGMAKARGNFLLGQLYQKLGMKNEAYKALSRTLRQSPPYEMRLSTRVLQTEVLPSGDNKRKLAKLKSMARNVNNKKYLDQIYYAIGNIYKAIPDTAKAIEAYETGGRLSERSSYATSFLMYELGEIYWNKERFSDALRCYKEAMKLIRYEDGKYVDLKTRTQILSKLAPYTDEIFYQDSIQALTRMSEADRNAVIDKAIEIAKLRQKEEEKLRKDSIAAARRENRASGNTGQDNMRPKPVKEKEETSQQPQEKSTSWYFYDQQTVAQGINLFKKQWGKRENTDLWRISNKAKEFKGTQTAKANVSPDSTKSIQPTQEKEKKKKKRLDPNDETNPLNRAYYLAQLPFDSTALEESNKKLSQSLFNAGKIEMEDMANYPLAHRTYERLLTEFPNFKPREQVLYNLYIMELRWGTRAQAEQYKKMLQDEFADNDITKVISNPFFEEKARYGKHREDSLYAEAYEAFVNNDYATIERNCDISDYKYPDGDNRAKFLFLKAMTSLRKGNVRQFALNLDTICKQHKDDEISVIASSFLDGVKQGRKPIGGEYTLADFWESRKSLGAASTVSIQNDSLTDDRNQPYTFILQYNPDSVNEGKLLYTISRFNFTQFTVRNFDISIYKTGDTEQMILEGFDNFDEVFRYTHELGKDTAFQNISKPILPILISKDNLQLVGTKFTLEEYLKFYQEHYVPVQLKPDLDLDSNHGKFIWDEFQEVAPKPDEKEKNDDEQKPVTNDDDNNWY